MKRFIYFCRIFPIVFFIDWSNQRLIEDLERWKSIFKLGGSKIDVLAYLLYEKKEFRNLFVYRNRFRKVFRYWVKVWYPTLETLYIEAKDIEGGLFIQHGFSTMISAEHIGKNCWINQQVTIGYKDNSKPPIIGDNVTITCGAKVLGNIKIGNNSVIGANSVVIKDVREDSIMVGIPAHRLERRN